jgi:hypothetical protein
MWERPAERRAPAALDRPYDRSPSSERESRARRDRFRRRGAARPRRVRRALTIEVAASERGVTGRVRKEPPMRAAGRPRSWLLGQNRSSAGEPLSGGCCHAVGAVSRGRRLLLLD